MLAWLLVALIGGAIGVAIGIFGSFVARPRNMTDDDGS
jgi:hypothetical protein